LKFYYNTICSFGEIKRILLEKVIIITASKEIIISKETHENYQFDKMIFFALTIPFLLIASFLTLHLADIFKIPELLSVIVISSYIILIYPVYKISNLKIDKQNKKLKILKEMITADYKTCKFCSKQLSIKEFYIANKKVDLQKISTIWNSRFYGLLCCNCFENTPTKFWIKSKVIKKL